MKINEVSKQTGLPVSTLRFYERKGLIPEWMIDRDASNYRVYKQEVIGLLQDMRTMLSVGFTVQELSMILTNNEMTDLEKMVMVEEKIQKINTLQNELASSKAFLQDILAGKSILNCND